MHHGRHHAPAQQRNVKAQGTRPLVQKRLLRRQEVDEQRAPPVRRQLHGHLDVARTAAAAAAAVDKEHDAVRAMGEVEVAEDVFAAGCC
jgi:hypothetical protein